MDTQTPTPTTVLDLSGVTLEDAMELGDSVLGAALRHFLESGNRSEDDLVSPFGSAP